MIKGASLSEDGTYRYTLARTWGDGPIAVWVMLNPSTADAEVDDPTIRKCIKFSKREGMGGLSVVNLFGYRSPDPKRLSEVEDPIGPLNRDIVRIETSNAGLVIAGWGRGVEKVKKDIRSLALESDLLKIPMKCLGTTKAGHPRHPLYLRDDTPLVDWKGY